MEWRSWWTPGQIGFVVLVYIVSGYISWAVVGYGSWWIGLPITLAAVAAVMVWRRWKWRQFAKQAVNR